MTTKSLTVARGAASAAVLLGTLLGAPASSAGATSAAPGMAATLATSAATAYDRHRPSAEYGLAVFDRQFSRTASAHGYYRHPYSRYRPYYPYYRPYYRSYYYPYSYSYYGAWGYPAAYGGYYRYDWSPDAGALDLNIKPKRAEVWVDREYLGSVDSYDGFPRYLWLRSGTHHLVVYLEGYETLAREVTLRAGEVLAIRYDLRQGVAKKPDELFAQLAPEPQARARDEGREERLERAERARPRPAEPADRPEPRRDDWRDGSRAGRVDVDQRSEPGRLRLVVTPSDAVVYLDGRLLGSGRDLERLHSDLLVDAGTHRLEATRPGYRAWEREIAIGEGEALTVRAELETEGR